MATETAETAADRRARWAGLAALLVAPLLAKLPLLLGLLKADPLLLYGGLQSGLRPGWLPGYPPYPTLDKLIQALVDDSVTPEAAARRAGVSVSLARDIARRIDGNEYKRRQAPPGPKVTGRAFAEGRRYPIAQKFRV